MLITVAGARARRAGTPAAAARKLLEFIVRRWLWGAEARVAKLADAKDLKSVGPPYYHLLSGVTGLYLQQLNPWR